MKRRRAFTLIELLVVIAIIALLVSILMPSLQKAKELAKDVVCRSNQKNVSLGIMLYAEVNDDALPYNVEPAQYFSLVWPMRIGKIPKDQLPRPPSAPQYSDPNTPEGRILVEGFVEFPSFGNNSRIPYEGPFICPSFLDQVNPKSTWIGGTSFQLSMNVNCNGGDTLFRTYGSNPEQPKSTRLSDVRAGAVLIGDCNLNPGGNIRVVAWYRIDRSGGLMRYPGDRINDFGPWPFQRHVGKWQGTLPCKFYGHSQERANLSYADTHVESVGQILHKEWKIE